MNDPLTMDPVRMDVPCLGDYPLANLGGALLTAAREDIEKWCNRRKKYSKDDTPVSRKSRVLRLWKMAVLQWHWLHEMPVPARRISFVDCCNIMGWERYDTVRNGILAIFPPGQLALISGEEAREWLLETFGETDSGSDGTEAVCQTVPGGQRPGQLRLLPDSWSE
jgi:hypothetical protein